MKRLKASNILGVRTRSIVSPWAAPACENKDIRFLFNIEGHIRFPREVAKHALLLPITIHLYSSYSFNGCLIHGWRASTYQRCHNLRYCPMVFLSLPSHDNSFPRFRNCLSWSVRFQQAYGAYTATAGCWTVVSAPLLSTQPLPNFCQVLFHSTESDSRFHLDFRRPDISARDSQGKERDGSST